MSIFIIILTFFVGSLVGRYTIFLIEKSLSIFLYVVNKFLNKYFVLLLSIIFCFLFFSIYLTGGLMLWHALSGGITELGKLIYFMGWVVGAIFFGFHPENNKF
ncbi:MULTISPECIES: hypothetical protein [Acinetobacter]|uniref:hypothetical protein n=1 Tax=Acinetobacter TaxID=469 RepID=UPI000551CA78|nr:MULTISPECIES: hypothetical protein [Acinetobacter]MCU4635844.1 hypothetical protein [Acinetobacter sp. WU_MDCI_Abxa265]RFF24200.1 hypothetical protein DZ985_10050 [Acinetobacter sp. JW]